jgi:Fur family transcriptional regulator, ferric uptake regulator
MIPLSNAPLYIPLFVLDISANKEEKKYLEGIGVFPESLITVIKNTPESANPVLIEVHESQFMIGRDLSKEIFLSPALEQEGIIFQGNKTEPRKIILNALKNFTGHFTIRECINTIQKNHKNIGEITIYRAIKILVEKKILSEIELPDGTKKMELLKGHHDHIFCQNCGNIIEFYDSDIEELQRKIAQKNNVELVAHKVILIAGHCPKCSL